MAKKEKKSKLKFRFTKKSVAIIASIVLVIGLGVYYYFRTADASIPSGYTAARPSIEYNEANYNYSNYPYHLLRDASYRVINSSNNETQGISSRFTAYGSPQRKWDVSVNLSNQSTQVKNKFKGGEKIAIDMQVTPSVENQLLAGRPPHLPAEAVTYKIRLLHKDNNNLIKEFSTKELSSFFEYTLPTSLNNKEIQVRFAMTTNLFWITTNSRPSDDYFLAFNLLSHGLPINLVSPTPVPTGTPAPIAGHNPTLSEFELNACNTSGRGTDWTQVTNATPTTEEKNAYGANAKAYEVKIWNKRLPFRVVLSASQDDGLRQTGMAKIKYKITFKGYNNSFTWGLNNKIAFVFTGNLIRVLNIGTYNLNSPSRGEFLVSYPSTNNNVNLYINFSGAEHGGSGSYQDSIGCITNALRLPADFTAQSPSPTSTPTSTPTPTPRTPTPTPEPTRTNQVLEPSPTPTPRTSTPTPAPQTPTPQTPTPSPAPTTTSTVPSETVIKTFNLEPGFTAFNITSDIPVLNATSLRDQGVRLWAYNRHGDNKWYTNGTSVQTINHRLGYYLYNPERTAKTIKMNSLVNQTQPDSLFYVVKGWNLLANSDNSPKLLSEMEYYINPCPPDTSGTISCQSVGTKKKLSDLFIGSYQTQEAYPVLFRIIDRHATDAKNAFREMAVTERNRESLKIPANTVFWLYVWPE